LGVKRN